MKEIAQIKFDKMVKEVFVEILKPLGFKRKGNSFYLKRQDLGQLINLQKSIYYSAEHIHFTINTGIFVPECFMAMYHDRVLPDFPKEFNCLINKRIGALRSQFDTWYDVKEDTDETKLIAEMKENLLDFILPYFDKMKTLQDCIDHIENNPIGLNPIAKIVLYAELKHFDKAKKLYDEQLLDETQSQGFLKTLEEYGQKYGLI